MTERLANETVDHGEALLAAGEVEKLLEATTEHSSAEKAAEAATQTAAEAATQTASVEAARATAESVEQANPLDKLQASEAAAADHAPVAPPSSFLKQESLKQGLKSVQRQESKPTRTLSKVIHQPAVRATSEVAAKTVSRPSGLLGGGIAAFIGGSAYLYLAYHIGFVYQPTVFLALTLAGFIVGLSLELLVRLVTRRSSN